VKKDKIEINVYSFVDANGNTIYDFESMAEEFENKLAEFDENVLVMCSIEDIADDEDDTRLRLEMEELKAKQYISNQKEDGTIALA
tara:strand:- start:728 stop:985 length:258 start_codon:yes stop_codon:yes gene_type:complete